MKAGVQWAKTPLANKDVKIHFWTVVGHDGPGYVDVGTLAGYIRQADRYGRRRWPLVCMLCLT